MKNNDIILKLRTDGTLSKLKLPSNANKAPSQALGRLIHPDCTHIDEIRPFYLYQKLGMIPDNANAPDGCGISVIIDDDGYEHNLPDNHVVSCLYGSHTHGTMIKGDVLFISSRDEANYYSGIREDILDKLAKRLQVLSLCVTFMTADYPDHTKGGRSDE